MCRNHSHLVARFVGENTAGPVPVLMFALAEPVVTIEPMTKDGVTFKIPTSGLLYLPSSIVSGLSAFLPPEPGELCTSVFFIPGDVPIIMQKIVEDLRSSFEI